MSRKPCLKAGIEEGLPLLSSRREQLQAVWHKAEHALDALQRSGFADRHEHSARDTVGVFELLHQPLDFPGILALRVIRNHSSCRLRRASWRHPIFP
ncbi:MAG: hypothetical protein WB586_18640 [Chthoniobacterales bacterium]